MATLGTIEEFIINCNNEGFIYPNMDIESVHNLFNKKLMPDYYEGKPYLRKPNHNRPNEDISTFIFYINKLLYGFNDSQPQIYPSLEDAIIYGCEWGMKADDVPTLLELFQNVENVNCFINHYKNIVNGRGMNSPYYFDDFKTYYKVCKFYKFDFPIIERLDEYYFSEIQTQVDSRRSITESIIIHKAKRYYRFVNRTINILVDNITRGMDTNRLAPMFPMFRYGRGFNCLGEYICISSYNYLRRIESKIINYIKNDVCEDNKKLLNIDILLGYISNGFFIQYNDKDSIESIIHKIYKKYLNNIYSEGLDIISYNQNHWGISENIIVKKWVKSKADYLNKKRQILHNGNPYIYTMMSRIDEITYQDLTDEPVQKWIKFGGIPTTKPEKAFENSRIRTENEACIDIKYFKNIGLDNKQMSQICNSKDLVLEGKLMRHCVGGYVRNCESGRCFIFHCNVGSGSTVEIQKGEKYILIQNRNIGNSSPSDDNIEYVNNWIKKINKK